ncbi:MAG: DUF1549 and DUF1553 domain-containing protein, partial [Verrucomicrobiota bacterium]
QAKLHPAEEADRYELVRRAYFDLHGLPPTPEQVEAFVNDESPDAWPKLIQQLLDSPRYGERWAQHWLDVVRYADSDGYRADFFRPAAYRYRDYVIRSFNEDKPYDQFIKEQLAGDEIDPENPDVIIGTGFMRNGIYEYNQRNARMHWDLILTELTNVTGEAFLGIGIGCAQCHDHKFDPILQKDYYALKAFLATMCWPDDATLADSKTRAEFEAEQKAWEEATAEIRKERDEMMAATLAGKVKGSVKQFPPDVQAMFNKPREERNAYEQQMTMLVTRQNEFATSKVDWNKTFKDEKLERWKELTVKLAEFDHLKPEPLPKAFVTTDVMPEAAPTHLTNRKGKTEIEPAFLTLLDQPAPKITPTETTTGRRTALANWIANPENPLSTRVIVNRIWQHHFGTGIVPTPNDFGTLGEEPSHPQLLDWLTSRFVEGGWTMKQMHALIMNSAAYRQTARREPTSFENIADPSNRLLWRFPPRRLSAEQVRDAMLAASGELQHVESKSPVDGNSPHRSVYVKKLRNSPDKVLNGFDAPMGFDSAPTRPETTTPTQSLMLVNGDWALKRSTAFAKRLLSGKTEITATELDRAFQEIYGRPASETEMNASQLFIQAQLGYIPAKPQEVPVEDKFPGETGLRPISQLFSKAAGVEFGDRALWLQPGSKFQKLHLAEAALTGDEFTIEAVTVLDNIHKDASVNTLLSRWNGNHKAGGWTFGVTSAQSRYEPRNFIMQLVGANYQGNKIYEVVASDLRVPLQTPVYLAATVSARDTAGGPKKGTVTFYMKDLSKPDAELQTVTVDHPVISQLQTPDVRVLLSGREGNGHLWDGQLARLSVSQSVLEPEQLLVGSKAGDAPRLFDFKFAGKDGETPAPGSKWVRQMPKQETSGIPPQVLGAMTDFCHALFNSNEFL